jgi:hypothetical protein
MIRTLTLRQSGAFQIVHDNLVQVSGDDPQVLPEPIRGVVLERLSELQRLNHFEVHYEQRDDTSFTHLRPQDAQVLEVMDEVASPGFFVIHENATLLIPVTPEPEPEPEPEPNVYAEGSDESVLDDSSEGSYEGPSVEQDGEIAGDDS